MLIPPWGRFDSPGPPSPACLGGACRYYCAAHQLIGRGCSHFVAIPGPGFNPLAHACRAEGGQPSRRQNTTRLSSRCTA